MIAECGMRIAEIGFAMSDLRLNILKSQISNLKFQI
jgi:hypothetical protein